MHEWWYSISELFSLSFSSQVSTVNNLLSSNSAYTRAIVPSSILHRIDRTSGDIPVQMLSVCAVGVDMADDGLLTYRCDASEQ